MLRFYTNQELASRLSVPTARWKRWSREFLPPDPLGGLQSGYARRYSVDDALTVFFGGVLVADLKFGIPEARRILADLNLWFSDCGVFTGVSKEKSSTTIAWTQMIELSAEIHRRPIDGRRPPTFQYRLRGLTQRRDLPNGLRQEQFVETWLPEDGPPPERFRGALLRVTDALEHFVTRLDLDRRYFEALHAEK